MLLSTQANRYANQLLDARANAQRVTLPSTETTLSTQDAYDIAKRIYDMRIASGEVPVGSKIGFSNRGVGAKLGINTPIWSPLFDSTVRYADHNHGIQSLKGALQPRIEPEIVFKLGTTPAPDATLESIADCIESIAHGIEIVVCPFADWKFSEVDAIASFGLHGTLIIGEQKILSPASRRSLANLLRHASVSLSSYSSQNAYTLRAAGFGSNLLESPVHALLHLHQLLQSSPRFPQLKAGDIVTTGTWTDAYPVKRDESWTTAFSGIGLPGLTLSFV